MLITLQVCARLCKLLQVFATFLCYITASFILFYISCVYDFTQRPKITTNFYKQLYITSALFVGIIYSITGHITNKYTGAAEKVPRHKFQLHLVGIELVNNDSAIIRTVTLTIYHITFSAIYITISWFTIITTVPGKFLNNLANHTIYIKCCLHRSIGYTAEANCNRR